MLYRTEKWWIFPWRTGNVFGREESLARNHSNMLNKKCWTHVRFLMAKHEKTTYIKIPCGFEQNFDKNLDASFVNQVNLWCVETSVSKFSWPEMMARKNKMSPQQNMSSGTWRQSLVTSPTKQNHSILLIKYRSGSPLFIFMVGFYDHGNSPRS